MTTTSNFNFNTIEKAKKEFFNCININQLFKANNHHTKLSKESGLYFFWFTGNISDLIDKSYYIKGNGEKVVKIQFDEEWIEKAKHNDKVCLYVGKTTNIYQRIISHLKLNTKYLWENHDMKSFKKPNSVSQLRIGIERIISPGKFNDQREFIKKNIEISWIELKEDDNAVNRFYLEDYFIGKFFPLFNVDIER